MIQKVVIIEDEPIARKGMEDFVGRIQSLALAGSFANPLEAFELLQSEQIDVLLLDIKTPEINGISFLKTLPHRIPTIITTAYSHYAVESFELSVVDYLLKPISFERFVAAINKLKPQSQQSDFIFIKSDTRIEKIFLSEILYVKALENYVVIHTDTKKFISYLTLKSVAGFLPEDRFVKVHKSYIVSIPKITAIEGNTIHIGLHEIAFNRNNKEEVLQAILRNNYLKR